MANSADGLLLATSADDKSLKIFDVINFGEKKLIATKLFTLLSSSGTKLIDDFLVASLCLVVNDMWFCLLCCLLAFFLTDMINMFKLKFLPSFCEWIFSGGAATAAIAWSVLLHFLLLLLFWPVHCMCTVCCHSCSRVCLYVKL